MMTSERTGPGERLTTMLASLSGALDLDAQLVGATYRDLIAPWTTVTDAPDAWRSEVSDDHTPLELSVSLERDRAELRILFEPQAERPTIAAARRAGLSFHVELEAYGGACLERLRRVEGLFLPEDMQGRFATWSSVTFARGEPPAFAVYLNPRARGVALAPALVEEALQCLDVRHAWPSLSDTALRRGPALDEIAYFAIDLRDDPRAQVKVYVHHHAATAEDLAAACGLARGEASERMRAFARAMRGSEAPMIARAPLTCHAFTTSVAHARTSVYVPVCAYAHDDASVKDRVMSWLARDRAIEPMRYRAVIRAAAARPLEEGIGLQSWVALPGDRDTPRLTVHLATEARRVCAPGMVPARSADPLALDSAEAVVAWLMARPLGAHPLLRRIGRIAVGDGPARRAAAARHMHETFADLHPSRDAHEALGAMVAGVSAVRLFDTETPVERPFHDLLALARLIPRTPDATAAFARGAIHVHRMLWRAMDAAYPAAFRVQGIRGL